MTMKSNNKDYYFLYMVSEDGRLYKLGKNKDPEYLEEKFKVYEQIQ